MHLLVLYRTIQQTHELALRDGTLQKVLARADLTHLVSPRAPLSQLQLFEMESAATVIVRRQQQNEN